jgi:hypothetical protein
MTSASTIFGFDWTDIQRAQQGGTLARQTVNVTRAGDYGCDPLGDGTYRMVPSGDVVDAAERDRRLSR